MSILAREQNKVINFKSDSRKISICLEIIAFNTDETVYCLYLIFNLCSFLWVQVTHEKRNIIEIMKRFLLEARP